MRSKPDVDLTLVPDGEVRCEFGGWASPRPPVAPVDPALLRWLLARADHVALFREAADVAEPPSKLQPWGRKRRKRFKELVDSARRLEPEPTLYRASRTPACQSATVLMWLGRCTADLRERLVERWAPSLLWPGLAGWEDLVLFRGDRLVYRCVSHEGFGWFFCRQADLPACSVPLEADAATASAARRLTATRLDLDAWRQAGGA